MLKILTRAGARSGEIRIGAGLYSHLAREVGSVGAGSSHLVISQPGVLAKIPAAPLRGFDVITMPDGERAKTLVTVRRLIDQMVSRRLTRDATLVAVGGGVVGDVAGFAASIYLRGVDVIQVPTSLLAQVDSSVGGKTGVNHPAGKNLIGTFHQPRLVIVDPGLLGSLPRREFASGLYEAIKYGVIRDPSLFSLFEEESARILARDSGVLTDLVHRCLQIKAEVVEADERETDLRRILNFGHTIGHGIEAALRYRTIRHGEAVGYGMIGAARIAERLGLLGPDDRDRIERVVGSIGPLPSIRAASKAEILASMAHDKKVRGSRLHFVLPDRIGRVRVVSDVPAKLVAEIVRGLR